MHVGVANCLTIDCDGAEDVHRIGVCQSKQLSACSTQWILPSYGEGHFSLVSDSRSPNVMACGQRDQ